LVSSSHVHIARSSLCQLHDAGLDKDPDFKPDAWLMDPPSCRDSFEWAADLQAVTGLILGTKLII